MGRTMRLLHIPLEEHKLRCSTIERSHLHQPQASKLPIQRMNLVQALFGVLDDFFRNGHVAKGLEQINLLPQHRIRGNRRRPVAPKAVRNAGVVGIRSIVHGVCKGQLVAFHGQARCEQQLGQFSERLKALVQRPLAQLAQRHLVGII